MPLRLRARPHHRYDVGDGQTTVTYDNITPPTYKKIESDDPDRLVTGTSPCTYMWYLDMTQITDIKVRSALMRVR